MRKMKKSTTESSRWKKAPLPHLYTQQMADGVHKPQDTTRDSLKNYPRREEKTMRLLCVTCAPGLDSQSSGAP